MSATEILRRLHAGDTARQDPSENIGYEADFEPFLTVRWSPDYSYSAADRVRPPIPNGFEYECVTAGRTGQRPPYWPKSGGAIVEDGSVVWTARPISTSSLRTTLSSAAWTATGLTLTGEATSGQKATAFIAGGTDGQDYEVVCVGTMADGSTLAITATLEVRRRR